MAKHIEVECENCGTSNPFYTLNCSNCKSYLRARVVNIDFWSLTGKLIESPVDGFQTIIFSEHKNFWITVLTLFSLKLAIVKLVLTSQVAGNHQAVNYIWGNLLISFGYFISAFFLFSFILFKIYKLLKIPIRWKDTISVNTFSFLPLVFALGFLFPLEYALFGKYLITFNPSPFILKETAAYVLTGIEGLFVIWSFVLLFIGVFVQTKKILAAIIGFILIAGIISSIALFAPLIPLS